LGLPLILLFAWNGAALGDQVETTDGRLFSGTIKDGVSNPLSIDDQGVIANISRNMIMEISKGDEEVSVETTTGATFIGNVISEMPAKVVVKTSSGVIEIEQDAVKVITFSRKPVTARPPGNEIEVKDRRQFEGEIKSSIPDPISINVAGVIFHINRSKIREIRYEEGNDVIETAEDEIFKGEIITAMPTEIVLRAKFGTLQIRQQDIVRIAFEKAVSRGPVSPITPTTRTRGVQLGPKVFIVVSVSVGDLAPGSSGRLYGGSVEFPLTRSLVIRAEACYASTSSTFTWGDTTTTMNASLLGAEAVALLYLSPVGLRPYAGAGVGLVLFSVSFADLEPPITRLGFPFQFYTIVLGASLDLFDKLTAHVQAEFPYWPAFAEAGSSAMPIIVISTGVSLSF